MSLLRSCWSLPCMCTLASRTSTFSSAIDTDQKKNKKFQRKRYIFKYIYAHIFSCTPKYQLESFVGILLCWESMSYLQFIENSHLLVYFYCTEEISGFISLCSTLWHMWRWCFRGVTQHPRLDGAILTEYCWFAYVIDKSSNCQNYSFQKLLHKDFKQFCALPPKCVCIFLHLHTWQCFSPTFASVFWVHLVYFLLYFSPDVHFMCKA